MTPEQLRAFAAEIIAEQGREYDYLGIFEAAEASPNVPGGEISEDDGRAVCDLVQDATITVTWPETGDRG